MAFFLAFRLYISFFLLFTNSLARFGLSFSFNFSIAFRFLFSLSSKLNDSLIFLLAFLLVFCYFLCSFRRSPAFFFFKKFIAFFLAFFQTFIFVLLSILVLFSCFTRVDRSWNRHCWKWNVFYVIVRCLLFNNVVVSINIIKLIWTNSNSEIAEIMSMFSGR